MKIISLENIHFKYPQVESSFIFENFSCSISKGEIIRVEGRNGRGKSTLLKIIANELEINEGKRIVYGKPKIIYLNQNASNFLADDLTIKEQLMVSSQKNINSISKQWQKTISKYALELELRENEFIGHLSGGQKQIIALLTAIYEGCDLICLDEFSSGMDSFSKNVSLSILTRLNKETDLALIEVSHTNELSFYIDRKITL